PHADGRSGADHDRRADRGARAAGRRARAQAAARNRRARCRDPADRAEADDRPRDLAPAVRNGAGQDRVRRQRGGIARQWRRSRGMAGSLTPEAIIGTRYDMKGRVAVVTLDNPPVNGLGYETRSGIVAALDRANADAA